MLNSDEMDIADLFHDPADASMMDPMSKNAMMDALVAAGVDEHKAEEAAKSLCSLQPNANFMGIYGRSISDYAAAHCRNLNIEGLGAFDLRTLKDDGQPWEFT